MEHAGYYSQAMSQMCERHTEKVKTNFKLVLLIWHNKYATLVFD